MGAARVNDKPTVPMEQARRPRTMDESSNARDTLALGFTAGVYAEPDPWPALTNVDALFFLSEPSPWNASRNSAYALAACSSSSLRFASAASFSFSRFDFLEVP